MRYKDLSDMEFGYWKVLEYAGSRKHKNGSEAMWKCQCKCGKIAIVSGQSLRNGKSNSCGCWNKEVQKARLTQMNKDNAKHGGYGTRLYNIWHGMKERCCNTNSPGYKKYGAKGITICDEWKDDFVAFRKWALNNGYRDDLSIDRIDGTKGYKPDNCRWATAKEQCNNLCTNILITHNGKTQTAMQWSEEIGLSYGIIIDRYHKNLPPERILEKRRQRRERVRNTKG